MVYIDVTDVLPFFQGKIKNKLPIIPTGIERVILNFALYGLQARQAQCIYFSEKLQKYAVIPNEIILQLCSGSYNGLEYLQNIDISRINFLRIKARYRTNKTQYYWRLLQYLIQKAFLGMKYYLTKPLFQPVTFQNNDKILFLHTPIILRYNSYFATIKKKYNLRMIMFLHDLLAITLPSEYILSSSFKPETQFFMNISGNIIDQFLTSTHYWANFVKDYMQNLGFNTPVDVIKFGCNSEINTTSAKCPIDGKFVLSVSTIEVRKNHINLVKAWKILKDRGIITDEKCVIVGKWGWKVEELKEYLNITNNCDSSIIVFNNLGNDELTSLYQNCMFTVFPSLAEGYGLPIVESLCYGKLCITSNTTAMPEVGGIYAEYIDPYNAQDIATTIAKYLTNNDTLQQKNQEILNFKATSWEEASKFLFAKIK